MKAIVNTISKLIIVTKTDIGITSKVKSLENIYQLTLY